jgi:eukaryotic-like serine/threonine-protein kinase
MTVTFSPSATSLVGKQLGSYRIMRSLGHGGSARVYLGVHVQQGTQVAIKVLRQDDAQGALHTQHLRQLRDEAELLARLHHPHIVRAIRYSSSELLSYLVLEYAGAGTLRKLHPIGTRLPLHTIVAYVRQIANALQYIHNSGLIHRDVKPENILLTQDGRLILSDFGIALTTQRAQQGVETLGTAPYAAPEQIRGFPVMASDQYALAALVYEWLSGYPPFEGTSNEIVHQHLYSTPPSLSQFVGPLPPAIEQVIMKALAKQPGERFQSVREFALALERASMTASAPHTPVRRQYRSAPYNRTAPNARRDLPHTTSASTSRPTRRTREELFNQVALRLMSTVLL